MFNNLRRLKSDPAPPSLLSLGSSISSLGSSRRRGSSRSHLEEYDEMIKSNIHPIVMEDDSVCSNTLDMSMSLSGWEKYEDMRCNVESLREDLAARDNTIDTLEEQLGEERRAHQRLKRRWKILFGDSGGSSSSGSSGKPRRENSKNNTRVSRRSSRRSSLSNAAAGHQQKKDNHREQDHDTGKQSSSQSSSSSSSRAQLLPMDVVQRLSDQLDRLEEENKAFKQKTIDLCLALSESKAKNSSLEAKLEESLHIISFQNSFPLGFWRAVVEPTVGSGTCTSKTKEEDSEEEENRHELKCPNNNGSNAAA